MMPGTFFSPDDAVIAASEFPRDHANVFSNNIFTIDGNYLAAAGERESCASIRLSAPSSAQRQVCMVAFDPVKNFFASELKGKQEEDIPTHTQTYVLCFDLFFSS